MGGGAGRRGSAASGSGSSRKGAAEGKRPGDGKNDGANNPPTGAVVKKRKSSKLVGGSGSGSSGSSKKPAPPKPALVKDPELPDEPEPEEEAEEVEEEEQEAEEEEEEEEEAIQLDDDPLEMLMAQGISRELSQKALDNANGDIDRAVMLIIQEKELAAEEKLMAAAMEESLKEAEEDAAKRGAEETEKKASNPLEFFRGSSFLANLGEELAGLLLSEGSESKDDLVSMLEFERQCKRWYRNVSGEVERRFSSIAAELVANLDAGAGGRGEGDEEEEGDDGAPACGSGGASGGAGCGGAGGGGGGGGGIDLIHSMLVAHLMALKDAVLSFPEGAGGVPDVFSPSKDAAPEEIDLTDDRTNGNCCLGCKSSSSSL